MRTMRRPGDDRYQRQQLAFPHERRRQTFIAELGGRHAPETSAYLKAGAAAAGIPRIWADFHGVPGGAQHWLTGGHLQLVAVVNSEVEYDFIDSRALAHDALAKDMERMTRRYANSWVVVHIHDVSSARSVLLPLADSRSDLRVLLVLTAPGGLIVERMPDATTALSRLDSLAHTEVIPQGDSELAIVAAGMALGEVMLGGTAARDDLSEPRTVGFYSLHRRRRANLPPKATLDDLVAEVAVPLTRATFTGRQIAQIGGGALGNWTAICMAGDRGLSLDVTDGDREIHPHNLNRQVLLVDHVGRQPKAPALAEELRRLDSEGTYRSKVQFVTDASDLEPLADVDGLVVVPDNDRARVLGAEAAWRNDVPYATAATGATSGLAIIQQPGRACFECITGLNLASADRDLPAQENTGNSCSRVNNDAVVAANMVAAGLLVSELREALSGRASQNLKFFGDSAGGNRFARMPSDPPCHHRKQAGVENPRASSAPTH